MSISHVVLTPFGQTYPFGEIDAGGVMGTGEYARSGAAVKNFVRKRPQKGTKGTEDIFCAFCAFSG